eukprot:m.1296580 g.1296580  ORF g.1296580 m.1296580 type:complete len:1787 (+) comp24794_c0_seq31:338-5698(+)
MQSLRKVLGVASLFILGSAHVQKRNDPENAQFIYIAQNGTQSNHCRSIVSPCPTMALAIEIIQVLPDLGNVTIVVGEGIYVEECTRNGFNITATSISILGHPNVPSFECLDGGKFLSLQATNVTVENIKIEHSASSDGDGAAISWACAGTSHQCIFSMKNGLFVNNTATNGGAVAVHVPESSNKASVAFDQCSFIENAARDNGGGVFVQLYTGSTEVNISETNCDSNKAGSHGGCMAVSFLGHISDPSAVYLSKNNYTSNEAVRGGGGASIMFANSSQNSIVHTTGCRFVDNVVSSGGGGAIGVYYSGQTALVTTMFESGVYMGNSGFGISIGRLISPTGGAILVQFNATAMQCHTRVEGGSYAGNSANGNTSSGGAICVAYVTGAASACVHEIHNGVFTSNTAEFGGAVNVAFLSTSNNTVTNFVNGTYSENGGLQAGGAISVTFANNTTDSNVTVLNGTYTNNHASGYGGGAVHVSTLNVALRCTTALVGGTYTDNRAVSATGGSLHIFYKVVAISNAVRIEGGTHTGNSADIGGAVYVSYNVYAHVVSNSIVIMNTIFLLNTAVLASGGAVCVQSYASGSNDSINVTGCTFRSNSALYGDGGALAYEAQGLVEDDLHFFVTAEFTNNTAKDAGGAVLVTFDTQNTSSGCHTVIRDCVFTHNTGRQGGAIAAMHVNISDFSTEISFSNFTNNTGLIGGDVLCAYLGVSQNVTNNFLVNIFNSDLQSPDFSSVAYTNGKAILVQYVQYTVQAHLLIAHCAFLRHDLQDESRSTITINALQGRDFDIKLLNTTFLGVSGHPVGSGLHMVFGKMYQSSTDDSDGSTLSVASPEMTTEPSCINASSMLTPSVVNSTLLISGCRFQFLKDTAARIMLLGSSGTSVENVSVQVVDCVFTNNTARNSAGGGLMLALSNMLDCVISVVNCTFSQNDAGYPGAGAGIAILSASTVSGTADPDWSFVACNTTIQLYNITAENNEAQFGGFASVNTAMLSGLQVNMSKINASGNIATSSGGVIFLECENPTLGDKIVISNSTFHNNTSPSGTSVDAQLCGAVTINNNTFNQTRGNTGNGSIVSVRKGTFLVEHNVFICTPKVGDIDKLVIDADLLASDSTYNKSLEFPFLYCWGGIPLYWPENQSENSIFFSGKSFEINLNITSGITSRAESGSHSIQKAFDYKAHLNMTQFHRYRVTCTACGTTTYQLDPNCGDCMKTFTKKDCCQPCPDHANCSMSVGLQPNDGYWRCPQNSCTAEIFACPSDYCKNGTACGEGRVRMEDNILCGSCEEGLSPVGEKCQDCSKHSALYGVLLVFATVALTGGFVYLGAFPSLSASKKSFFYFLQNLHLILGPTSEWAPWMGFFNLSLAKYMCVNVQEQSSRLWLRLGSSASFFFIWMIFALCDWFITPFRRSQRDAEHSRPSLVKHVLNRPLRKFEGLHAAARHQSLMHAESHSLHGDSHDYSYASAEPSEEPTRVLLDHAGSSCSGTELKPIRRESMSSVDSYASRKSHHSDDPMRSWVGLRLCRQFRYIRGLQYILLFSYESLTEQAMQIVNCISVGSCGRVLAAYPAVSCQHNPAYYPLRIVGICLLIYSVAFPMGLWYFLRKHCVCSAGYERNQETILLAKYGVLYDHFKPNFWWWEVQVLFRRMLVLVMYVTLYSDEKKRKYAIFVVSLAILMTHMVCLPYKHAKDNTVESISLASLVYAAGTVMTDDAGTSTTILHTTMIATLIGMGTVAFFDVGSTMYYSLSKGSRKMSDEDDRSVASMSVPNKDLNSSETAFQTDYVSIQGDATE